MEGGLAGRRACVNVLRDSLNDDKPRTKVLSASLCRVPAY